MNRKTKLDSYFDDNPEMKKIIFCAFYLVFFVFLIILLRLSSNNSNSEKITRENSGLNKSYSLESLSKENYHFNIIEEENDKKTIYDGDVNGDKALFVKSGAPSLNYYKNKDSYYLRDENTLLYDSTDNPLISSKFVESGNIKKLIVHGIYESVTTYFNGTESDYNYSISTSTILRNFDNIEADLDDKPNTIKIKVNDNKVKEIDIDLTSYYNYYDKSINNYKLSITYSKYGMVDEITSNTK